MPSPLALYRGNLRCDLYHVPGRAQQSWTHAVRLPPLPVLLALPLKSCPKAIPCTGILVSDNST